MKMRWIVPLTFTLILSGCDLEGRVSKLEKETKGLQAAQSERDRVADFDLKAKCAKDAKAWFNENWQRDKSTTLLDFINHYNKKENQCFVFVEYHYGSSVVGTNGNSWTNDMTLWNVYENSKCGNFDENHYTYYTPKFGTQDEVVTCEMYGTKCKTQDEFMNLVRPYMND